MIVDLFHALLTIESFFGENIIITGCRKIASFRLVYDSIIELAIYLQTSRSFLIFRFMKLKVKRNFIGSKSSYKAQITVLTHDFITQITKELFSNELFRSFSIPIVLL